MIDTATVDEASTDSLDDAVEQLERAAAMLIGADIHAAPTTELNQLMERLVHVGDQVEAGVARITGVWDARRAWAITGAKSGPAWLRNRCFVSSSAASRQVRLARRVWDMPKVEAAWQRGDIGADHVSVLANVCTDRTRELFERDEDMLVGFATDMRFQRFCAAVRQWVNTADTDGAEQGAAHRHEQRRLHHSQTLGGSWATDGWFDDVAGSEIAAGLQAEYDRLFQADWAEAKAELGREPSVHDLCRTPPQRRADAMRNLICRGHQASGGSEPVPLLNVLVGYETFAGPIIEHFNNHTVFTPGQIADRLTHADIRRIVFDGPERVTAVGTRTRFFTGLIRDAVLIRDRGCTHAICDEPVTRCDVDHVVPWPEGETSEPNGQAKCRFHHNHKTRGPRPRRDPAGDPG